MNLRAYRAEKRLTLAQLAERIGCSLTTVHDLENRKRRPSLRMVERIELATDRRVRAQDFMEPLSAAARRAA